MSKIFVVPEDGIGPGGDLIFRKYNTNGRWYRVYVDEELLGLVMRDRVGAWTGLSYGRSKHFPTTTRMEGFGSRYYAACFVIKHRGYWMREYDE